jgi:hypothetical protein
MDIGVTSITEQTKNIKEEESEGVIKIGLVDNYGF